MQGDEKKITPKQEKALIALLDSGEVKQAAEQTGVNESTLWRWLQDETFKERYRAARRGLVESAISKLQSDCAAASRVLLEIAEDKEASAAARVSAARTILEHSVAAVAVTDLLERIERLEKQNQDEE